MLPNVTNFYRPKKIEDAVALLNSDEALNVVLGGGTQLALSAHPGIQGLVDLGQLGLSYKKVEGDYVLLGSRLRPNDVWNYEELNSVADGIFSKSAGNYLADVQRNRASLGGILMSASAWADLATTLLAVGGEVVIINAAGESSLTIEKFFENGPSKVAYRGIIKELRIRRGGKGAYQRLAKTETDMSIVSVAVRVDLDGGKIKSARIAAGSAGPMPIRLTLAEQAAEGKELSDATSEAAAAAVDLDTVGDYRASRQYRLDMTRVLVRRCLNELAGTTGKKE